MGKKGQRSKRGRRGRAGRYQIPHEIPPGLLQLHELGPCADCGLPVRVVAPLTHDVVDLAHELVVCAHCAAARTGNGAR